MADHTLVLTLDGVTRFDTVDQAVAVAVRYYTGWSPADSLKRAQSEHCTVELVQTERRPRSVVYRATVRVVV